MSNTVQSFSQIQSLEALNVCLNTPLTEGEWGVLALDFDQTLVQAKPTLGDEHFYRFLTSKNRDEGLNPDAHYKWTVKVRANITYETCESVDKINQILAAFRKEGWNVKVLTSRGLDMKEITKEHLKMTGLALSIDDVIFKEFNPDGNGKLLRKNQSLASWMQFQPQWDVRKKVRILFLDDSISYCNEVERVATEIENATVTCFHYIGALPSHELSQAQLEQIVVQLYAHQEGRPIPYGHDQLQLKTAIDHFKIQEIKPDTVYAIARRVAEWDGVPFND